MIPLRPSTLKRGGKPIFIHKTVLGIIIFVWAISCLLHTQLLLKDHSAIETPVEASFLPYDMSGSQAALQNALTKIKARNAYLYPENTDKSQWGWKTGGPKRFQEVDVKTAQVISMALQPYYMCPWTLQRSNYVSETIPKPQFDGGKWTCGLPEISSNTCIVYSFGSNGDDFFEQSVKKENKHCEIHIFDPTSGEPPTNWEGRYHFHRVGLCAGNTTSFSLDGTNTKTKGKESKSYPCKSISGHMKELGHTHIDVLKADIEGMEWELLKEFNLKTVGQLLLEFHFWHHSSPRFLETLLRDYVIPLEKLGYFIHTVEPVAAQIHAYEITFLNVNWNPASAFDSKHKIFDAKMYPTTPNVMV